MAYRDGILRPLRRALWPARDEAEVDKGDLRAVQMGDEIGKHAGVKAPTVDEHETHLL